LIHFRIFVATTLPDLPDKRYFTIGEVSELCDVKPHVLRYWEQEFAQLRPMKRRGNRRYYQHHEVLLVRVIRELLYDRGYTISGARNQLNDMAPRRHVDERESAFDESQWPADVPPQVLTQAGSGGRVALEAAQRVAPAVARTSVEAGWQAVRGELLAIREMLRSD
jgi:DNA-binding transcriptional MerR regulator